MGTAAKAASILRRGVRLFMEESTRGLRINYSLILFFLAKAVTPSGQVKSVTNGQLLTASAYIVTSASGRLRKVGTAQCTRLLPAEQLGGFVRRS